MKPAHTMSTQFEDVDFLQQRLVSFAALCMLISFGTLFLFRVPQILLDGGVAQLWTLNPGLHFLGGAMFAATWWICRRRALVAARLRAIDVGALFGFAAIVLTMTTTIPLSLRPDHIALFAIGACFLARSVYIPSTGRFTLFVGIALGLPVCLAAYIRFLDVNPAGFETVSGNGIQTAPEIAFGVCVDTTMWWCTFLAIATMASNVIFGLRREVRSMRKLGQYTLEQQIGRGGMGEVWKARHAMLRRPTAVKLLPRDQYGDEVLERFEREVQHTADLSHPNTVTIYDYGRTPEGTFYYAMELIDGPTLAEVVERLGPFPAGRVRHLLMGVAGALREAHSKGLIHRDIKPSNIMLCRRGGVPDTVKVVDFGLVKELETVDVGITRTDMVVGTPHYISPEALRNPTSVDARSDLYSLGATAYCLLTGTPPFPSDNLFEVCSGHLNEVPVRPSVRLGRAVPTVLEDIILQCLAKNPEQRPASSNELLTLLSPLTEALPWTNTDAEAWWALHKDAFTGPLIVTEPSTMQATFVMDLEQSTDG